MCIHPSRRLHLHSFRAHVQDLLANSSQSTSIRVVDCEAQVAFDRAHIPGSVLLPAHPYFKSASHPNALIPADAWEEVCAGLGIGDETTVIFVDAHPTRLLSMRAAWVWRHYGHRSAWFLDGGWGAYVRSGARVSSSSPGPNTYAPPPLVGDPVRATAQPDTEATRAAVLAAVAESERGGPRPLQLLDTRTPLEHSGEDLRGNVRGGTIPGSVNVPHASLFASDGTLETPARLRAIFEAAGLDLRAPVAAYCQLGIRAAVAAVALREAGCAGAAVYDGGASEWLNDPEKLPVA